MVLTDIDWVALTWGLVGAGLMWIAIELPSTPTPCEEWAKTIEIAEACYKTRRCRVTPDDVAKEIRARNNFYEHCTGRRAK